MSVFINTIRRPFMIKNNHKLKDALTIKLNIFKVLRNTLLFFSFLFYLSSGNATNIHFNSLNVNNGLPSNTIRTIIQDDLGNIWLGTHQGLTRYDGFTIKVYQADKNKEKSLSDSFVTSLEIDQNNVLWIGTASGLNRYNKETDDFTVFLTDKNNSNSIISNHITSLESGDGNSLWVGTDLGLVLVDTKKNRFTLFQNSVDNPFSLPQNNIRRLMKTKKGELWIGSIEGLFRLDTTSYRFEKINITKGNQARVVSLTENQSGDIWISTLEGLYRYSTLDGSVDEITLPTSQKLVVGTLVDHENRLWFSTYLGGLFRLDENNNIINIKPDNSKSDSLAGPSILSFYQDFSGMIWLGTFRSGLSYFNPESLQFGSYSKSKNSIHCLKTTDFTSVLPLDENTLLLGTYSKGIVEIDLEINRCKYYDSIAAVSSPSVHAIAKDHLGKIWVATEAGLEKLERATGKFQRVGKIDSKSNNILTILADTEQLIIGSTRGLFKQNLSPEKFSQLLSKDKVLQETTMYSLVKDANGIIWVASQLGLLSIDKELINIQQVVEAQLPLLQQRMTSITIDSQQQLWLAIDGNGLFKYNPVTAELINFGERIGLKVTKGITGLIFDHSNSLWLATENMGLFKINPKSLKFTNFQIADGLLSNETTNGMLTMLADGRLFFGGAYGFNLFNPKLIKKHTSSPIVSITQLTRFGQKVVPNKDYQGFKIDKHITQLSEINLSYKDSVFGFEFIAIDFSAPEKIEYSYRLKGFEENWTRTNAQNRGVTYNNIDPGNYTFQLKARTENGTWNNGTSLNINISPAPWLTWWAYSFYLLSIILSIIYFIRRRTKSLQQRSQKLEELVSSRTNELIIEKNKVEQLLLVKQQEFANISHEFRTPLTLILGPAQVIETMNVSDAVLSKIEVIKRNANRLLRMVEQLLQMETFKVDIITRKKIQDFQTIIRLISESFADLASNKNIQLEIKNIEKIFFEFTPDALEKIILNLLSNALKYSSSGDRITIEAKLNQSRHYVITVKDTGIGIEEEKLSTIFDRFQRVYNENSDRVKGAGIGLALVKQITEVHGGYVEVESILGEGTTFRIYLPVRGEGDYLAGTYQTDNEAVALELADILQQFDNASPEIIHKLNKDNDKPVVLIVEDNQDMRTYIIESLKANYQCLPTHNGETGKLLATEYIPDIIISDVMMPKIDGYQLTQSLKSNPLTNHIPIILLTALGDKESRLKGWKHNADEYLTKPFDTEELRLRIQNLLINRELLRTHLHDSLFKDQTNEVSNDLESVPEKLTNQLKNEQRFLSELNNVLESLYLDPDLKIDAIANKLCMSQRQLLRKLKYILDLTPIDYLRRYRLEKAKVLLAKGYSASKVAFEVGFSTHSHFGKSFKEQYGCVPSEYKKSKV